MKLTLERKDIKDAVAGLSRVISKRTSLPILACVRIASDKAGCTMTGTDLDQTLAFKPKSAAVEGSGAMIVPFETLNLLTKGPDAEPVIFVSGKKKELTILNTVAGQEVGRTFEVADPDDWPASTPAPDVGPVDPAFLPNFRRASLFASDDSSRLILNGVCLHVDGKAGDYLVATDGRRMGAFNTIKLPLHQSCVVPTTKFMLWSKFVPDELLIGAKSEKDTGWFRMVTAQWDYRCRTQQGTYPNWKMVVPGEDGAHQFSLSETDAEMLKKILPTFAGHDAHNKPVKLDLRDSKTFIVGKGENDRQPSRLELTDTRSVGKPGEINVDRTYLLDALNAGFRVFRFEDGMCPMWSRSDDGGIHVLMPLRMDGPVQQKPQPAPVATQVASDPVTATATPPPETSTTTPKKETENMSKQVPTAATTTQPSALERVIEAYEFAKTKVREANDALALIAAAVKDAAREAKAQRQEVESVRSGLAKLQQIKV